MGRSARVALSFAATDGSELHRIKSRSCQSRDGPDGIAGREFSFATRADPGKESHADTRSTSRARRFGECACRCVEVRTACGSGRALSMFERRAPFAPEYCTPVSVRTNHVHVVVSIGPKKPDA